MIDYFSIRTLCNSRIAKTILGIFFIGLVISPSGQSVKAQITTNSDKLSELFFTGHGVFYDLAGSPFVPDRAFIQKAQRHYVSYLEQEYKISNETKSDLLSSLSSANEQFKFHIEDRILSNASYIDWLVNSIGIEKTRRISVLNEALRNYYLRNINRSIKSTNTRYKPSGITDKAEFKLKEAGLWSPLPLLNSASFANTKIYVKMCRSAGVPVPDTIFSSDHGWVDLGDYEPDAGGISGDPNLWVWYDENSPGTCIANRISHDSRVHHIDMICLGLESSKACFFERIGYEDENISGALSTTTMDGALNIRTTDQCTDCHAGENPFIVHPDSRGFRDLDRTKIMPREWYIPIAPDDWPRAEPANVLEAVSSLGRCTDCHNQDYAGRLPRPSTETPLYCTKILQKLVRQDSSFRTMPAEGAFYSDIEQYLPHYNTLVALCSKPPGLTPEIVDFPVSDKTTKISPPIVFKPIYACPPEDADRESILVKVHSAILGSTVSIFINGVIAESKSNIRDPDNVVFSLNIKVGDIIEAKQEIDGVTSEWSSSATVKNFSHDFPNSLPAPRIDPTSIYECASKIAVRHIPGVEVTVDVNGNDPKSIRSPFNWTVIEPTKRPFERFDKFVARATMCNKSSEDSEMAFAGSAPTSLRVPQLNPPTFMEGQELLSFTNMNYGAKTFLELSNEPLDLAFSWPMTWRSNIDGASHFDRPFSSNDSYVIHHQLCDMETISDPIFKRSNCSDLLPPVIEQPYAGNNYVMVVESVPGARVRIFDNDLDTLGDSSGSVIELDRNLIGSDIITAVQKVGDCTSRSGYQIGVL